MEVNIPKLTVRVSEDDGFSLGKLSGALIAGFGIHWAWVYLCMFSGARLFFWFADDRGAAASAFYLVSLTFLVATLLSYAIWSNQIRRLLATGRNRRTLRLIGGSLVAVGTVLVCFAALESALGLAALAAAGAATGIGTGVLLMSFGVSFGQCDTATIVTSTALSLLVGIAVYAAIMQVVGLVPGGALMVVALPFVECWCLQRCSRDLIDKLQFADITIKVRKAPFALRIGGPSLLFGFAVGSIRTQAIADLPQVGGPGLQLACIVLAACAACGLLIAAMLVQRQHLDFLFRTMLPVIAVASAFAFFAGQPAFPVAFALVLSYFLFEAIMWASYGDVAQRFRLTSFIVFGYGRSALAAGALLGAVVAPLISPYGELLGSPESLVLMLTAMVVAFGALPRGSEIRALLVPESENPAGDVADENGRMGEAEHAGDAGCAGDGAMRADGNAARRNDDQEERERTGRFKRKCITVANRYLLSKKETEVLFLLAKGRNAAHIQEQLFISEGTARTHMRHIYKKMDIHTQQELIDTVESAEE